VNPESTMMFLAAGAGLAVTELPTAGRTVLYLAGIAFFLLLNAFFVASEFAIMKTRIGQLESEEKESGRDVRRAMRIATEPEGYLSAHQFGITLSSLALGFLGAPFVGALLAPVLAAVGVPASTVYWLSLAIAFAAFTFLHVILGELVPKAIAIRKATSMLLALALPIDIYHSSVKWIVWLCSGASNWLLKRVFRIDPPVDGADSHSAEELAQLVAQSGKSMEVTETEREILINALELNDLWVRDVMTPRNKVIALDADAPFDKVLEVAIDSKHTRFPLVKGHLDQAIGLIHIKDLFKLLNHPDPDLMRIKRDLKIVPDTMPLDMLLKFFLKEHAHLALAVDEFGTPVGVVFLDNVMEELVGDIHDEFDTEPSPFTRINDEEFVVEGTLSLNDLAEYVPELFLESEEVATIGGHITQHLGRFPEVGETVEILGYEARVTSADGRRVGQIHFRKLPSDASGSDEAAA
jgi:CBS domain containing-hemolysin-like protein